MKMMRTVVLTISLLAAVAVPAHAQFDAVGSLDFPTSSSGDVEQHFLRGVAILHSFGWVQARDQFQEAQALDPDFAMAYWGESLAYNPPLVSQMNPDEPRAALQRLAPTKEERLAKAPTEREKGFLSAVEILDQLGITDLAMVGVAKGVDRDHGKEEFHRPGQRPFALRMNDPVLYFVQRLRDEAHRYAIGTHRAKRAKSLSATPLDDIVGVGGTRKRALLSHFGSAKAVSRAGLADLKAVDGISDTLAETIYAHFHEKG